MSEKKRFEMLSCLIVNLNKLNPSQNAIPEEFIISAKGPKETYEIEYLRYSNLVPTNVKILAPDKIEKLTNYMELIQDHFSKAYNKIDDLNFAMEIEFKITSDNILVIKQARPWVH